MLSTSALKKQISDIKSTAKITKAMELVSTAKLKKLSKVVINSKAYFSEIYTVFNDIISQADQSVYQTGSHFSPSKTAWIIINSSLGLCGGYNLNVHKLLVDQIKPKDYICGIGSKLQSFIKAQHLKLDQFISQVDLNFKYEDGAAIMGEILSMYNQKKINCIKIAYTRFVNNVTFEPLVLQLLPITKIKASQNKFHPNVITEFDPSAEAVLDDTIPLYLNAILYSSVLESQLSEQASRRNAMQNATNNANDLIDKLSISYNRRRQANITQELIEIISGVNAQQDE